MITDNPLKAIDEVIEFINHDSYFLSRDDQTSIEWRLREVQNFIAEKYKTRGCEKYLRRTNG